MSSGYARGCLPGTNCVVTVPQDKWFAVQKFGQYQRMLGPGLNFTGFDICGCCITYRSITSRVVEINVEVNTKTKDNVFVKCLVAVQQSVVPDQVQSALYKLANVESQIDSYVSDVIRSQVPRMTLDEAFEKKDEISVAVQEQLAQCMKEYGFQIHRALVTELAPNRAVMDAMNEINKQTRLRDAAMMAAEAEKIKIVKAAEAAADAAFLQGQGIARQRAAIIDGLRDSICGQGQQMSAERVSELMLITQYFETMRDVAANPKANVVFVPAGHAGSDICQQIRDGVLQATPMQSSMK
eukprot:gnl/TRDRNA2_/TRDRNA2_165991_c0_seq2.p1 gnl/TRDRNA2_/TRDRNA2_165991_c0~~gnl/TRDRNA2_/TRDRNA2_165991_c0_seq2.p1  ORF type:complete len:297 (-),score=75.11 gnl/TRDRNA2_/TRDRNA2_165991_c0_seq2:102-992(-)